MNSSETAPKVEPARHWINGEWVVRLHSQIRWAREATVPVLAQIVVEHYGATDTSFLWEQQLLNQGGSNRR